jgi:hypothetical protein
MFESPIHTRSVRRFTVDERREKKGRFQIEPLEERIAPSITPVQINGGGNTPNGNANGVPTTNLNPAGHAPPGQN